MRLEHEDVDPALQEAVDLLPEQGPAAALAERGQLVSQDAQGPHGAPDEGVPADHVARLARDLRGAPVEPGDVVRQAEGLEPVPVGTQGEGDDQLGAGLEVLAVRAADQLRARRRELVEAGPLGDAAAEEEGPHATVGEERAVQEAGAEAGAGRKG